MSTAYYVSFRLDSNTPSTKGSYDQRYAALQKAIKDISDGYWLVPTSFGIFSSLLTFGAVAAKLKAAIDPALDVVILGMIYKKGVVIIGAPSNENLKVLRSMVPDLETL